MKTTANFIEELLQRPIIESDITDLTFSMVGQLMRNFAEYVRDEDRKTLHKYIVMGKKGAFGVYWNQSDLVVDNDSIINIPKQELK